MNHAIRNFLVAAIGAVSIAACGGGSGDGGLTGGGNPPNPATITSQNAPVIAGVVAEVALGQGVFDSVFGPAIPIAAAGPDAAVAPVLKPVLSAAMKAASPSRLYVISTSSADCAVSGSVDMQADVSDPAEPSVNDSFVFEFMDCDDGAGAVMNGGMTVTITAFSGDPASGEFLLGMSLEFSAFSVSQDGETTGVSGDVSLEIDTRNPPLTRILVSANTFVTTSDGTEEILTDFTIDITEDGAMFPVAMTVETSFTISSPRIGGDVSVTTSLSLESMGEDYPFAGELRIEGADGAIIVMIALDANTVRLEIDIDGDGGTDDTIDLTWDELLAAAA